MARFSSRWKRYTETGARRQAVGLLATTVILILAFVIFGFPLLLNLASRILSFRPKTETNIAEIFVTPDPPRFVTSVSATKSAQFTIIGFAQARTNVELLQNNISVGIETASLDGQFKFDVDLNKGKNSFTAKAAKSNRTSELSEVYDLYLLDKEPKLVIDNPKDGDKTDNNYIDITGLTDPSVTVTINNRLAIVNSDGSFKLRLVLKSGDNNLTIIAKDLSGTETKKDLKITSNY